MNETTSCLSFRGRIIQSQAPLAGSKSAGMVAKKPGLHIWFTSMKMIPISFKHLNGRFQGLVADRTRGTVTLFNDRFGLQRVYFHEAQDAFYFSAESKAILEVRRELRSVDSRGLGEFIACGCVLENRTLFKGIYALPPASAWSFRGGALDKKEAYFEPREWEEQEPLDAESYYKELRDAFTNCLPRYFNGSEPIGVSLTGGLDTRIIMAWRKAPPGSLPCYTFGSMYRENQDVYLARRVANICSQPYQVVTVDEACMAQFPALRGAHPLHDRRMRGYQPVRGSVQQSDGSADCAGAHGWNIWQRDHSQAVMFKPVMPSTDIFRRR